MGTRISQHRGWWGQGVFVALLHVKTSQSLRIPDIWPKIPDGSTSDPHRQLNTFQCRCQTPVEGLTKSSECPFRHAEGDQRWRTCSYHPGAGREVREVASQCFGSMFSDHQWAQWAQWLYSRSPQCTPHTMCESAN